MSKKIIIIGGLGYIGTELCKIYSGYSWTNKIIVIDNRFISERVNQIRNWNMEFVHGDILDKEIINKHCKDADVVHHLAGITDVPRTRNDSNETIDNKIKTIASKCLSPMDMRLIKYRGYTKYNFETDDLEKLSRSMELNTNSPTEFTPFKFIDIPECLNNYNLVLFPIERCLKNALINHHGFFNIIYVLKHTIY